MSCSRAKVNLKACEGATFESDFVWKTGDPAVAVDLTGYTGVCHIRNKITDEAVIFTLTAGVGVIIADQTTTPGGYSLFIPATDMEGACEAHKIKNYLYDLRLTAPSGDVRMQQYGSFIIEPAVTRPWT